MNKFFWVPEAPGHPGLYANLNGNDIHVGKISGWVQPSTYSIHHARQFNTYEECRNWCINNQFPKFIPKEHGICSINNVDMSNN